MSMPHLKEVRVWEGAWPTLKWEKANLEALSRSVKDKTYGFETKDTKTTSLFSDSSVHKFLQENAIFFLRQKILKIVILLCSRAGISSSSLNILCPCPPKRLNSIGSPMGQADCLLAQEHIDAYLGLGQDVVVHSCIHSSFLWPYFCHPRWGQYLQSSIRNK